MRKAVVQNDKNLRQAVAAVGVAMTTKRAGARTREAVGPV
jgi:hypothetical protein